MKTHQIRHKITLLYTGFLTLMIAFVLAGTLLLADRYFLNEAKQELSDELFDFTMEFAGYDTAGDMFPYASYYDDGVLLSIYEEDGTLLTGLFPDHFPSGLAFEEQARGVSGDGSFWVVADLKMASAGQTYWIRGIYPLDLAKGMEATLLHFMGICCPLLILIAAFIGYRMITAALHPIYTITDTVNSITESSDLSLRLPEVKSKDELSCLTETFNHMLDHLEEILQRQKQFTSDAAHELRTPLSVIISHCEYCLADLSLEGEAREELSLVAGKARSMSELVSELLVIARAENGSIQLDYEETDLRLLAETVLEELGDEAAARSISLHLTCGQPELWIDCDFSLVMQLLINLVENAIRYGRDGGQAEVSLYDEGDWCRVDVRDNGIGIPPESLDKVWDRFYRVDASGAAPEGSGVGLFLVKCIAQLHGGTVEVKSMPEVGSVFRVRLPRKKGEPSR